LTQFARELRKRSTMEERIIWKRLRGGHFSGFKFRRQHPINHYIADFICIERALIVELDGGHHGNDEKLNYDAKRDAELRTMGYRILRFPNRDVKLNLDGVLNTILAELNKV